jgi:integrase
MPRPRSSVPAYRLHKGTGQAVCFVDRREVYLGKYDSPESRKRYAELIRRLTAGEPIEPARKPKPAAADAGATVNELLLRFAVEELPRYATAEQFCIRGVMKITRELFGETAVADFGPLALRAVRNAMVAGDPNAVDAAGNPKPRRPWSRSFTNKQTKRLRLIVRWGVSWQLVPQTVADALATVRSLGPGDSEARETTPRRAVPDADITAIRAELRGLARDVFDLLLLTGARSGELLGLRSGDIDRTGEIWRADLAQHKTAHKGKSRTLFFNADAQAILQQYLSADPDRLLFPIRRDSFGAAVKRASIKAGCGPITPHWLRHTVATRLADQLGTEAAQRLLGHADAAMTEHYSRAAERVAADAARSLKIG